MPGDFVCRCTGGGSYVVEVPLADAVVLTTRLCLVHTAHPGRDVVHDELTDRLGEVMRRRRHDLTGTVELDLRPIGGGIEWTAYSDHVRLIRPASGA